MKRYSLLAVAIVVAISLPGCNMFEGTPEATHAIVSSEPTAVPTAEPTIEPTSSLDENRQEKVTLYFSDMMAEFVIPEIREIELVADSGGIEKAVVDELIKGPAQENANATIPEGTRVITAETKNGVCSLNLSKEFIENSFSGSAGETMTVYSIVNSLTELDGVDAVQFLIEGKKREVYIHMALDTPIKRDENIIHK